MKRFVAGADRAQSTLLPESLDDWVDESNPVRVVDAFVDALDIAELGFEGVEPAVTGRPSYHPSCLLKLYIYGYLNRVQSSRRLEREAGRNLEVMWLLGRLAPDHKTIADFRKDNGSAIKKVCARFVELCRRMGLLSTASVAIDGSKFKAVNNRDKNFTTAKIERRRKQLEESVSRYLSQLDTADRQDPSETLTLKKVRIKEKLEKLQSEMAKLAAIEKLVLASPDQQICALAFSAACTALAAAVHSSVGAPSVIRKIHGRSSSASMMASPTGVPPSVATCGAAKMSAVMKSCCTRTGPNEMMATSTRLAPSGSLASSCWNCLRPALSCLIGWPDMGRGSGLSTNVRSENGI